LSDEPVGQTPVPTEPSPASFSASSVRRRLVRGSSWTLAGRVSAITLGLAINAILARLLTPRELGAYFAIFSLVVLGTIVGRLGMDLVAVRFVSAALATGQSGRARQAIRTVFAVGTLGALVAGLVLALGLGSWLAQRIFHSQVIGAAMPLAAAWLVMSTLRTLLVATFMGLQQFALTAVFDSFLVDVLSAATFGTLLMLRVGSDVSLIVALSAGFAGASALIAAALLVRRLRRLRGQGRIEGAEVFAMAWPVLVTDVASYFLSTGVDLWILGAFRPQSDVALYGAASRLLVLLIVPFQIFQGVAPPLIAELHAQGRRAELERALRAGATLAAIPAFLVLVLFVLFGSPLMGNFYGPFYSQGATILAILSVGRLALVWTGSSGIALLMTGHQRAMMSLTILSGVTSIGAGVLAAAHFGPLGIATTTAGVAIIQNVLQLILAKRFIGVWTHVYLSPRALGRFLSERESPSDRPA
jgi:O-antigen/teichoic acid export membrane protein